MQVKSNRSAKVHNYMPYGVWNGIKFTVVLFIFCPGTDISAAVQPIGVKFCMTVQLQSGRASPLLVIISYGLQMWD